MARENFDFFKTFYPVINYNYYYARDLFKFFSISDLNDTASEIIETYWVKDGETLQSISDDLYETQDYWWVIALINNMTNLFEDFPKNKQTIYNEVIKINGSYDNIIFEELLEKNDQKREIIILKANYLEKFVSDLSISMSV